MFLLITSAGNVTVVLFVYKYSVAETILLQSKHIS